MRRRLATGHAGLDPAIHLFRKTMDHRVSALRAGPVMTPCHLAENDIA